MDERRQYFRIKNHGEIKASLYDTSLEVVEISSKGALIIKKQIDIPTEGIMQLQIHSFTMELSYKVIRMEEEKWVLLFNNEEQIDKLFTVLKRLRDERKKK
ncbi:hypothetical protein EP47_11175 [Legionella norrlandica]|uniref:PilZ domain-containing protein n=1 Tax=Legionella norrlandica TaxID=1498499 RepID=A0A0A2T5U4_9GAMM|nr:PilZ domain-containing protein [Legionella norrlandica]KGP62803.1 hypothetical protein EP47_11175 [Legionella norrlandica]